MEGLTSEQLLAFIKKQKAKIKSLEAENERLLKTTSACEAPQTRFAETPALVHLSASNFWITIRDKEASPFHHQLARLSLLRFLSVLSRRASVSLNEHGRFAFLKWKLLTAERRVFSQEAALSEARQNLTQAEQRIAKLKALLARTHQSRQRSQEDTQQYRKAQVSMLARSYPSIVGTYLFLSRRRLQCN
jgi:hypothetical protein